MFLAPDLELWARGVNRRIGKRRVCERRHSWKPPKHLPHLVRNPKVLSAYHRFSIPHGAGDRRCHYGNRLAEGTQYLGNECAEQVRSGQVTQPSERTQKPNTGSARLTAHPETVRCCKP